jgi:hypothetical protein
MRGSHDQPIDVAVVSYFMANVPKAVVDAQRRVVERFLPADAHFLQILTGLGHGESLDNLLATTAYDVYVVLDIDCVPLREGALEHLIERAATHVLVGAVGRHGHLGNPTHLYVSPFCMAFSRLSYMRMGHPSFTATPMGDIGQELTYRAESLNLPVEFLRPTASDDKRFQLDDTTWYGRFTVYDDMFVHALYIRDPTTHTRFVARCDVILARAGARRPPPQA